MRVKTVDLGGLPDHERHGVLTRRILPEWTAGAVRQQQPVVVFVAGQPGSGKTQLARLLQTVLNRRGGAVRIGRDLYKPAHPWYAGYLAEDVRTAGVRVRPETSSWQEAVEEYVRRCHFDAVIETALADPAPFRTAAAAYRAAGFRREVVALAVAEAVSQHALLDRFLGEVLDDEGGRYVGWGNHDVCATGLLRTLAESCRSASSWLPGAPALLSMPLAARVIDL